MTTCYKCNGCGDVMEYEDERYVILSNVDREKISDLCPKCKDETLESIARIGEEKPYISRKGKK